MTGKTHAAAGVCAALLLSAPTGGVVLAGLGALLPDIDCASSELGKNFKVIGALFEHRSFTHSLLFVLLGTLLSKWVGLGILTHLLLDMMTKAGIRLLWPWKKKLRLPFAKYNVTDSAFETAFRYALLVVIAIIAFTQTELGIKPLMNDITGIINAIK